MDTEASSDWYRSLLWVSFDCYRSLLQKIDIGLLHGYGTEGKLTAASVSSNVVQWRTKETYINQKRPTKETYINQKRPTKETYINQKRPTKETYIKCLKQCTLCMQVSSRTYIYTHVFIHLRMDVYVYIYIYIHIHIYIYIYTHTPIYTHMHSCILPCIPNRGCTNSSKCLEQSTLGGSCFPRTTPQVCCSVLQCVAVCCSVLQCVAVCW